MLNKGPCKCILQQAERRLTWLVRLLEPEIFSFIMPKLTCRTKLRPSLHNLHMIKEAIIHSNYHCHHHHILGFCIMKGYCPVKQITPCIKYHSHEDCYPRFWHCSWWHFCQYHITWSASAYWIQVWHQKRFHLNKEVIWSLRNIQNLRLWKNEIKVCIWNYMVYFLMPSPSEALLRS